MNAVDTKVSKTCLVHLNKNFHLAKNASKIKAQELFTIQDVSAAIGIYQEEIKDLIKEAQKTYRSNKQPSCQCRYKAKINRCPEFERFNPDIPSKHSIFELSRVLPPTLKQLMEKDILRIADIDVNKLTNINFNSKHEKQIDAVRSKKALIDKGKILKLFKPLQEPLYFLDYETIGYPIPVFAGSRPYQHIPFQFSLHKLQEKNDLKGDGKHYTYLMQEASDQALQKLLDKLREVIGVKGSVIVWHKSAEQSFHRNLMEIRPETSQFLQAIDQRMFDLEQPFLQQAYVHPDFCGKTSLKSVLPVLSKLSYKDLGSVQEGQQASMSWSQALSMEAKAKQVVFDDLDAYCKLDTLATVKIYQRLMQEALSKEK